ncbi:MAG: hypothetical protein ABIV25_10245, partial [Paracoccaceae bacterium]
VITEKATMASEHGTVVFQVAMTAHLSERHDELCGHRISPVGSDANAYKLATNGQHGPSADQLTAWITITSRNILL